MAGTTNAGKKSLTEFAIKPSNPLFDLSPEIQNEIILGRQQGIGAIMIARWLSSEHGIKVSENQVRSFFLKCGLQR